MAVAEMTEQEALEQRVKLYQMARRNLVRETDGATYIGEYLLAPESLMMPWMDDEEFATFYEDFERLGQRRPVVLNDDDDAIIDGKHRALASMMLDTDLETVYLSELPRDMKAEDLVYSEEFGRRHQTKTQKAMSLVLIRRARGLSDSLTQIAKSQGVSESTIHKASTIVDEKVASAVADGTLTLKEGIDTQKLPEKSKDAVLEKASNGDKVAVKEEIKTQKETQPDQPMPVNIDGYTRRMESAWRKSLNKLNDADAEMVRQRFAVLTGYCNGEDETDSDTGEVPSFIGNDKDTRLGIVRDWAAQDPELYTALRDEFTPKEKKPRGKTAHLVELPEEYPAACELFVAEIKARVKHLKDMDPLSTVAENKEAIRGVSKTLKNATAKVLRDAGVPETDPVATLFDVEYPEHLDTEEFREGFAEYVAARKAGKLSIDDKVLKQRIRELSQYEHEDAVELVLEGRSGNKPWKGFEHDYKNHTKTRDKDGVRIGEVSQTQRVEAAWELLDSSVRGISLNQLKMSDDSAVDAIRGANGVDGDLVAKIGKRLGFAAIREGVNGERAKLKDQFEKLFLSAVENS